MLLCCILWRNIWPMHLTMRGISWECSNVTEEGEGSEAICQSFILAVVEIASAPGCDSKLYLRCINLLYQKPRGYSIRERASLICWCRGCWTRRKCYFGVTRSRGSFGSNAPVNAMAAWNISSLVIREALASSARYKITCFLLNSSLFFCILVSAFLPDPYIFTTC